MNGTWQERKTYADRQTNLKYLNHASYIKERNQKIYGNYVLTGLNFVSINAAIVREIPEHQCG